MVVRKGSILAPNFGGLLPSVSGGRSLAHGYTFRRPVIGTAYEIDDQHGQAFIANDRAGLPASNEPRSGLQGLMKPHCAEQVQYRDRSRDWN
jgi:hypothetical protein